MGIQETSALLASPRGSRPLAVFIGACSLAACIPLLLPTQWRASAAFLCLCRLSEMKPGLGEPGASLQSWLADDGFYCSG